MTRPVLQSRSFPRNQSLHQTSESPVKRRQTKNMKPNKENDEKANSVLESGWPLMKGQTRPVRFVGGRAS